jgi:hypothetical protein
MISAFLMLLQAAAPAPAASAAAPAAATPPAPWALRTRTDAASGAVATSASATARDGSSRMVLRCDKVSDPVVSLQFITKQVLANAEKGVFAEKPVSARFDAGPALEYNWEFTTTAAYIRDPIAVTALAVELAKAKEVKVSTTNANKFVFEGTIDGPAGNASIGQVLAACGYVLGQVPAPVAPPKK